MHADTALTAYDKGLKLELRDKITAGAVIGSALVTLDTAAMGDELEVNDEAVDGEAVGAPAGYTFCKSERD